MVTQIIIRDSKKIQKSVIKIQKRHERPKEIKKFHRKMEA